MDPAWPAPAVTTLYDLYKLSLTHTGRSSLVYSVLPQAEYDAPAAWALVRHAPVQSDAMDSCVTPGTAEHLAHLGGCALSPYRGLAPMPWRGVPGRTRNGGRGG